MALYLQSKKLDITDGNELSIILNKRDCDRDGINSGDMVELSYKDLLLYVEVEQSDTEVAEGEIGLPTDLWQKYSIPTGEYLSVFLLDRPESIEYIKKKLLGSKLNEYELEVVTRDIADRKIREVEVAYFMSTFFNPGFDDDELIWTIKGMAKAGDILNFRSIHNNGDLVVDKHSIGGVASKGITPILVSLVAAAGLVIPNTSTRAITAPAGTTDLLEVLMPVALNNNQVLEVVGKTGGCMIWGGALRLSPADDVLIGVERGLHAQSFQKMLVSIIAKKVSMGISHIIIDIPYGPGTKVEDPDDVEMLKHGFIEMFSKVGIKCEVHTRHMKGPDGYGIGPLLEARDVLRILERTDDRPKGIENSAIEMAAKLFELSGLVSRGKGISKARELMESGKVEEKFWEIAFAQGATKRISSEELIPAQYSFELVSSRDGVVEMINNKELLNITRALGNPKIPNAGLYLEKLSGDLVSKGERLLTIFASSTDRLKAAKRALKEDKLFKFR